VSVRPLALRLAAGAVASLAVTSFSGCLAYHAVAAPVKLAATGVVVAGETAGAVVTSTGKIAVSTVRAVGNVGSTGIDSAAKLAEVGMVTFVDTASGTVVRVPWQDGITLLGAGDAAKVSLARRAIDVVRAGKLVYSASHLNGAGATLASGDVVRLKS
jgi:hypothetical protein